MTFRLILSIMYSNGTLVKGSGLKLLGDIRIHKVEIVSFCTTGILREINFVDSRSAKTAVFAILGAVNFVHMVNFSLQKLQKFMKIKIQSL